MTILSDSDYINDQYNDSSKFDARVLLYELFATNKQPWLIWLFDCLRLNPGESVLELGAGTGNVWRQNRNRIPDGVRITLSDFFPGMLEEARRRLGEGAPRFQYKSIDAQEIPFHDESFEVVLASHMLYHVPDRAKALSEAKRVMQLGGRLYVGTNDWTHLQELRELVARFEVHSAILPPGRHPEFFDLENAGKELSEHFAHLDLHRYRDTLKITEVAPLLDYIRSDMSNEDAVDNDAIAALGKYAQRQINLLGSIYVGVSVGVFEAIK